MGQNASLPWWLRGLLLLTATCTFLSFGIIVLAHIDDGFHVDHVSGVWIGLAGYLNEGTLYPDVYQDGHYGGSRYMPLYFALHAGLARLTGDYVFAGKLLSLAIALVCAGLVFVILMRLGADWIIALALTVLGLTSASVWEAGTTIRGDLLPVVWLLAALLVMECRRSPLAAVFAGLFCTLAMLSKFTAGWAPLAIVAVTWRHDRKFLATFLASWLGSLAAVIMTMHVLSAGRLWANMGVFSEPAFFSLLLKSPARLLRFMTHCSVLLILMPFVLLECVRALGQRRLSMYHWSFFLCVPMLLVIFADRGTTSNHLVDLTVLSVLLLGPLWEAQSGMPTQATGLKMALALALLWGLGAVLSGRLGYPLRDVLTGAGPIYPSKPLAAVLPNDAVILTEDPRLDIMRGQLPVVLDPYALVYIEKKHPEWVADLVRRVQAQEFPFIVLNHRLDLGREEDLAWYGIIFGRNVSAAIRGHYRFHLEQDGYCVFVPN